MAAGSERAEDGGAALQLLAVLVRERLPAPGGDDALDARRAEERPLALRVGDHAPAG